jgi:transcriptional antiterminator Rof (Rho-off)
MKISYKPTFDQFADNYLSTYYSGGVRTLQRAAGGPTIIVLGALAFILIGERVADIWLRIPLNLIAIATVLYGLSYTIRPLFNVFLVWLRRNDLFESKKALTTLELKGNYLHVDQSGEKLKLPLDQIVTVQHRSVSTWILTKGDVLIYIPRQGLKTGSHDKFVAALDKALAPEEEEE